MSGRDQDPRSLVADESTQPELDAGDVVPRPDAESIDPVQERRALARLQSKLFGRGDDPLRIGRYELGKRLGSGGMGIVYEAEDPSLHRKIAIKLVRAQSAKALQSAITEARALAAISEPNVVTVFDAGLAELDDGDTTAFIAMELVDGPTLAAWLDGTHGWREVLRKFVGAGRGLAAAHRRGVVHGDFKPGNVLFARGGRPLVCDFGLARLHDPEADGDPSTSAVRGTPGYIAPELIAGERPTARSDQFAFCVALHRALRSAAMGTPLGGAPLIASALPPLPNKIPAAVEAAVRRGFETDPERRFASMEAVLAALRNATRTRWYRRPSTWVLAIAVVGWIAVPRGATPCPDAAAEQAQLQERVVALPELEPASAATLATARLQERLDAVDRLAVEACRADDDDDDDGTTRTLRCLSRRRKQLDHLIGRIAENPSAHTLLTALTSMDDPAECTAASADEIGETSEEADAIEDILSASSVAEYVGEFEDAQTLAMDAVTRAMALGSPALLSRAHLRLADALYKRGAWEASLEQAEAAYQGALDGREPDIAVIAATRAMLAAYEPAGADWMRWRRHAEAALQQTDAIRPRAILASRLSIALEREGKYAEALEQAERAHEAVQELAADPATEDRHLELVSRQLRGVALFRLGRFDEAEVALREALAEREEQYATTSPNLAPLRHQLAVVLRSKGKLEEALALVEINYEAERAALPAGHPDIIGSMVELAGVKRALGRFDEAETDLLAATEELRPDSASIVRASVLIAHANVLTETNRFAEAEAKLTRARTLLDAEGESVWHARLTVLLNLAELHRLTDQLPQAMDDLATGLENLCPHLSVPECKQAKAAVDGARQAIDAADADASHRLSDAILELRTLGPTP